MCTIAGTIVMICLCQSHLIQIMLRSYSVASAAGI